MFFVFSCYNTGMTLEELKQKTTPIFDKYRIKYAGVFGSFARGENKTDSDMHACLDSMSLSPSEVAVVGDRIKGEIALGIKMGMKTIWYKVGKFANELPLNYSQEPQQIVTKLEDVMKYV